MLKIKNIDVSYLGNKVLKGINIEVNQNEIISIVGANSAGKSTIMKTISGLIHPISGTIDFLGKRINHLLPHQIVELGIVQVPEGRRIFAKMTLKENLEICSCTKKSKGKRQETMMMVYNIFPILKERENQIAGSLSGGEQQMLAIGMSLMPLPILLLLDEPSVGLSPLLVLNLFKTVDKIHDNGVTVLLCEQHVKMSLELAHRGYVIENGRIVLQGTGSELLGNHDIKKVYLGM